ncbi:hypothetical protein B0W47_01490 [Komagataeibacter nataicola]|uniref:Uncharacterized protein n=1 Tax=Komagataeibacter nataicola TaxID=265960 RepID=A0A9N7CL91_9PROT|nr:hypothetical protein [Komagataeibacter nataicola]AQU86344.1 hypothetical protein B0W47_01490 [Komagataeibacter nataicola]PYD66583.1 hypothetical protein CDI09_07645 [Komagataeibacter nataicola]WEQ56778.1 hypothetical protein LV564_06805 [Komagataeibacter nataicola]WNM08249.1 hypothetical protein RI056_15365 [Komagataeibacter nataicola]GBR18882.1 hypothetical protein AA0616_1405 [Komagataeibacter nataicola NRIC 0616]
MRSIIEHIRQINAERTPVMNLCACLCVVVMLGLANLICHYVLHTDMSFIMPWMLAATALYFFIPALVLWIVTGNPSGRS